MARKKRQRSAKYQGMTKRELLAMLSRRNRGKKRPSKRKKRNTMSKSLPPELRALAEALREFSKKDPSAAKMSAAERRAVSLLKQIRSAKKKAEAAARKKAEDEKLYAEAKSWVGGVSGDRGGRRRKKRKGGKRRKGRTNSWTSYVKKHAGSAKYRGKSARARMKALSADYKRSRGKGRKRARRDYGWAE